MDTIRNPSVFPRESLEQPFKDTWRKLSGNLQESTCYGFP